MSGESKWSIDDSTALVICNKAKVCW